MASYTYGYGNAYGFGGSIALAQIIYNMDTFNVTDAGLRTLDNSGSVGIHSDADIYGSNLLSLSNVLSRSFEADIPHTLGADTTINGIFDTDTDWNKQDNWIISGGVGTVSAPLTAGAWLYQSDNVILGETYLVTADVVVVSGTVEMRCGDTGANILTVTSSGTYSFVSTVAGSAFSGFYGLTGFDGSVDNFTTEPVSTPNSYLTYFDQATKKMITLGNSVNGGSSEGSNIVTDSDFNDSGEWTEGSGWTISGGKSISDGTSSRLYQLTPSIIGTSKLFVAEIVISEYASGELSVEIGSFSGTSFGALGVGVHSVIAYSAGSNTNLALFSSAFDGAIDSFTVKEILPISTTYTMDVPCQNVFATSVPLIDADRTYLEGVDPEAITKMIVELETIAGLSFDINDIGLNGNGDKIWYPCNEGEASGAYVQNVGVPLGIEKITNGEFDIDTTGWSVGGSTTASVTSGVVEVINPVAGSWHTDRFYQPITVTTGKLYAFSFDVRTTSGVETIRISQTATIIIDTTTSPEWSSHVVIWKPTADNGNLSFFCNGFISTFELDNITLRELSAKEIQNYNVACWTDFKNLNYGMTNILLDRDATGRITGIPDANLVEFADDNYATVDFKPLLTNFSLGVVFRTDGIGLCGLIGQTFYGISDARWGVWVEDGGVRVQFAGVTVYQSAAIYGDSNLHMASISVARSGNLLTWVDNALVDTTDISSLSATSMSDTYSNTIGAFNDITGQPTRTDSSNTTMGQITIEKETIWDNTAQSVVYTKAKTIYPTLP